MKNRSFNKSLVVFLALAVVLAGCAEMSPTLRGGAIGAGVGAATGATAGAILGEPGKGAGVGAVVGLVSGLIAGEMYSQSQKQQPEANVPRPPSESYSTTLTPAPKSQSVPLLLRKNGSSLLDDRGMVLVKELLDSYGIRYEDYSVSSAAKYPKSPEVILTDIDVLESQPVQYEVTLRLTYRGEESKYFRGTASTLRQALSQALFGK